MMKMYKVNNLYTAINTTDKTRGFGAYSEIEALISYYKRPMPMPVWAEIKSNEVRSLSGSYRLYDIPFVDSRLITTAEDCRKYYPEFFI